MGKIKRLLQRKSIKTSFVQYMTVCIFCAVLLSLLCSNLCQIGQSLIYDKYAVKYRNPDWDWETEIEFFGSPEVEEEGRGIVEYATTDITSFFTFSENVTYNVLGFFSIAFFPICFAVCIGITSVVFYKKQIQKPLEILENAADQIADHNTDFTIYYDEENELGKLCSSFENMRAALQENNMEMWRQMEERKRLNAAFAHDLRTPLTVLKGQSEMLVKYVPQMSEEKVVSTAETMQRHIVRLETYVNTMNDLQRLEDIEIKKTEAVLEDIIQQMRLTGHSVCQDKTFTFSHNILYAQKVNVDFEIVMRVYENLLSNALRFARENVEVSVKAGEDHFSFSVSDDGNGFSDEELRNAVKPFYKSANETDPKHLGMGLNICKIFCEKHGGRLELANDHGAVVTAVFKQ